MSYALKPTSETPGLWSRLSQSEAFWAMAFILPCGLGLLLFTYLPMLASFSLSFSYWNLLGSPQWVGLGNYAKVLSDPLFWKVFGNTWIFVIAVTLGQLVLGLGFALLLNRAATRFGWLMNLCRTAYFMPFVTPMVSVAIVWGWMVDPQAGLLNGLLRLLGYQGAAIPWLYQPETALWVVVALQIWKLLGYTIVIFLSGLQAVPDSVYESAELDGANPWQTFWRITLPLVSPTLFFVLMMTLINAFQVFDSVYLLTQGGPEHSTDLMVYWLFKNAFEFYQVGPASAIAYILCLVILVLTLIQWQLRKKWVLYESDQ